MKVNHSFAAGRLKTGEMNSTELREIFTYDPETGNVYWKKSRLCGRGRIIAAKGELAGNVITRRGKSHLELSVNGRSAYAHRVIWCIYYGKPPEQEIDHIDGNGLNNKIANLRDVSHAKNQRNMKTSKRNLSGITGVSFDVANNKWRASIMAHGKNKNLGRFECFEDAVQARKSAEIEYDYK